jgi:hypothetical protein
MFSVLNKQQLFPLTTLTTCSEPPLISTLQSKVVTVRTTCFNITKLCILPRLRLCFVWWRWTPRTVLTQQTQCVSCQVGIIILLRGYSQSYGQAVAYFAEALSYKPEGRGIESRWGACLSIYLSFKPHYSSGIDSASNRNDYLESTWGEGEGQTAHRADNLTAICKPIV